MSYLEMALRVGRGLDAPAPAIPAGRAEHDPHQPQLRPESGALWPSGSLDAERKFGQPHARLFPFIGRKVRTPEGAGMLVQVFAERVTVLLDSELAGCTFFPPGEIEPVSWELSE